MSRHSYVLSRDILSRCDDFEALIMSAMRKADDTNLEKLKTSFPEIWEDLFARYHAPGGYLHHPECTKEKCHNDCEILQEAERKLTGSLK